MYKRRIGFLLFSVALLFSSCSKSELGKSDRGKVLDDKIELRDGEKMDREGCFELIFPVSVKMSDGTILSGESRAELGLAIRNWHQAHPDAMQDAKHLIYPVEVIFKGEQLTIHNNQEMRRIRRACSDKDIDRGKCIELVFPVSYTMPDGSSISGNNGIEIRLAMKNWYEAHPDSKEKPALEYPVDILFKEEVQTVQNEEEMIAFKKQCADHTGSEEKCFDFIYPIVYTMPDGSLISGQDGLEIRISMKDWYEAHPDSQEKPSLNYPVKIKFLDDGSIKLIQDNEGLKRVYAECKKEG